MKDDLPFVKIHILDGDLLPRLVPGSQRVDSARREQPLVFRDPLRDYAFFCKTEGRDAIARRSLDERL